MIRLAFVVACAVLAQGYPHSPDSIVVVDSTSTKSPQVSNANPGLPETTASSGPDAELPDNAKPSKAGMFRKPKITSMHVESNVTLRYARTMVTSRVSNPAARANEVTFSVVIPETAFITSFSMEIDGKVYEAYVKEKAEAKKVYQTAVNSGIAAAHVAVQARDSNHFTVSVNVEAQSKAVFRLTYEEFLTRRLGLYHLVMNINPGQLLDDLAVDVRIRESAPITELFVPQMRTGNEVDAEPSDAHNEYSTQMLSEDLMEAHIHFAPNKAQQEDLMKIFKRANEMTTPSNFYTPFVSLPHKSPAEDEGLKGQFVVQYDVNRNNSKGQVLVKDGYFVHFFAPTDLKPLNKHVIFVLDVSGSMVGRKIAQLKEAMNSILDDLHPGDYLSIIDFSYNANVYNLDVLTENADFHQNDNNFYMEDIMKKVPEILPSPKPVTPENIAKAKTIINLLVATGGTNIHDALTTALKVANRGIPMSKNDTKINEKQPLPSPMIIFLTDGDPTVGDTNLDNIMKAVKSLNTKGVALFSLAFGEDADRTFLRSVSLQNWGFMRHIYEAADAAQQLKHFYKQVASPLLANITFTYSKDEIDADALTKNIFKYFFLGSELVIAGKVKPEVSIDKFPSYSVAASSIGGPIDFIPIPPETAKKEPWPLERMWVYMTIKQLLDKVDSKAENSDDENGPGKKALQLALKYSFVTPLTSLVVVKPNSTSAVDAESLDAGGVRSGAGYALPLMGGGFAQGSSGFSAVSTPQYSQRMHSSYMKMSHISAPTMFDTNRGYTTMFPVKKLSYAPAAYRPGVPIPSGIPIMGGGPVGLAGPSGYAGSPSYSGSSFSPSLPQPEYESVDSASIVPSTPPAMTSHDLVRPTEAAKNSASELAAYGLQAYPWLEQYLDSANDTIALPQAAADAPILKSKLKNISKMYGSTEEKECDNAVTGGKGRCRYLTQCAELATGLKDLSTYLAHSCDAEGFAGICCKVESP